MLGRAADPNHVDLLSTATISLLRPPPLPRQRKLQQPELQRPERCSQRCSLVWRYTLLWIPPDHDRPGQSRGRGEQHICCHSDDGRCEYYRVHYELKVSARSDHSNLHARRLHRLTRRICPSATSTSSSSAASSSAGRPTSSPTNTSPTGSAAAASTTSPSGDACKLTAGSLYALVGAVIAGVLAL